MNDDLREKLGERLWRMVQESIEAGTILCGEVGVGYNRGWLGVADECIRQMEWARLTSPAECGHCGRGEGNQPLTIAPNDWRP